MQMLFAVSCATAGEQRELVRRILHCILDAGYSPMKFFAKDYKKYFYLAELCSLVDLSAVRLIAVPLHISDPRHRERSAGFSPLKSSRQRQPMFVAAQMVKMGVQYSLWGGSVVNLGTEAHHRKYFDDIDTFRLPGTLGVSVLFRAAVIQLVACADMAHAGLCARASRALVPSEPTHAPDWHPGCDIPFWLTLVKRTLQVASR